MSEERAVRLAKLLARRVVARSHSTTRPADPSPTGCRRRRPMPCSMSRISTHDPLDVAFYDIGDHMGQ